MGRGAVEFHRAAAPFSFKGIGGKARARFHVKNMDFFIRQNARAFHILFVKGYASFIFKIRPCYRNIPYFGIKKTSYHVLFLICIVEPLKSMRPLPEKGPPG